jgi:hypothetical protein
LFVHSLSFVSVICCCFFHLFYFYISSEYKGKAPFVGFYNFTTPYLLIIDPELAKQIMIKDFKAFRNNEFSTLVSSNDL